MEIAKMRDQQMSEARKTGDFSNIGPLHGIPVSIKDQLSVKGIAATSGCAGLVGNVANEDASAIQLIREKGGIPFVKSNLP